MFYNQTIKIAFFISLTGHLLILGMPQNFFKPNTPKPSYITIHLEEPKLLPKIEKMGNEKILEKTESVNMNKTSISNKEAMLRYQDIIKQRIEETREYPEWAKQRKLEGSVHLRFTINSRGQLGAIQIVHSSNYKILNQSALETVKNAGPFPPIPEEIQKNSVNIEVSIVYLAKT